ncbi:MAG: hypothetical protein FWG02_00250 [Holophagaceae bacterium]|nr:hypothetical protein [Holophagaceae bacterium]
MLDFLLLDGFDPDVGELAMRVAIKQNSADDPRFLRIKLRLGHSGDALQPLKRELSSHLRLPLPPLWDNGIKLIIHAIEEDLAKPDGRNPAVHTWVPTQILHPTDARRCTLNHPVEAQARIIYEWAQRLELNGEIGRATELLERMLILSPGNIHALRRLAILLRELGLIDEYLDITEQWTRSEPNEPEAFIRHAEALIYLERPKEALEICIQLLHTNPIHPLAHIGAAQAKSLLGGNPYPNLDAAVELDRSNTLLVLKESYDYRSITRKEYDVTYTQEMLTRLLNVTPAEVKTFVYKHHLPLAPSNGSISESELSLWVGIQNRYNLLPYGLHWSAPTPRSLPDI